MIGLPRDWCVGQVGAGGLELKRGVWRTTLCELEVRTWIDSIDHIKRREASDREWVDWSKDHLCVQGARAVSRYISSGAPLRFWRKQGQEGCPVIDGELYEEEGLRGVMVFHADRPDWWIQLAGSYRGGEL